MDEKKDADFIRKMSIDDFLDTTGVGGVNRSLSNMIYGFNHARIRAPIPSTKSVQGWTFFTRPQLNLRNNNIRNFRPFYPLLNKNELSIERYVRVMLDPRLPYTLNGDLGEIYAGESIDTPLVDKGNMFIPLLTNSINSMSGWPDEVIPTFTSKQGVRREQISMVDGTYETNEVFDLNVSFSNYITDPIVKLFQTWTRYQTLVFEGVLNPYWDMVLENELDYNTRIYRITLDNTWTRVEKIAATGASFPISTPMGAFFDFSKDKPYNAQTKEINIRFKCVGAIYADDILIREFNGTNAISNKAYRDYLNGDADSMIEIPTILKKYINFRGYPYIDPKTYELKWLLPKHSDAYKRLKPLLPKDDAPSDDLNTTLLRSAVLDDLYYRDAATNTLV